MSIKRGGTPVEIQQGRRAVVSTDMPDWIVLSGASPTAVHIYAILNAHVNQRRGDSMSWPTQETLAAMVGLSRGDKVKPYTDELRTLGAIDIAYVGMPRRCLYTVHETPVDGYAGSMTVAEWYKRREGAKDQVSPVPPWRGELDEAAPVTPSGGELVTPSGGELVTPPGGGKQPRNNNLEKTAPPPPDPYVTEQDHATSKEEEVSDHEKPLNIVEIAAWFVGLRANTAPDEEPWTTTDVETVLATAVQRGLGPLSLAAQALRELVEGRAKYGPTRSPWRLLADTDPGCWAAVKPKAKSAAARRLAAEPRCPVHERFPLERCVPCMSEKLVAPEPEPEPDAKAEAEARAYVKAVRQRQRAIAGRGGGQVAAAS